MEKHAKGRVLSNYKQACFIIFFNFLFHGYPSETFYFPLNAVDVDSMIFVRLKNGIKKIQW